MTTTTMMMRYCWGWGLTRMFDTCGFFSNRGDFSWGFLCGVFRVWDCGVLFLFLFFEEKFLFFFPTDLI